jgi:hypothetical protein
MFNVKLRISGMSHFEFWEFSNVSACIAVAVLRVTMAIAVYAETSTAPNFLHCSYLEAKDLH